jgi:hypothetical protein
LIKVVIKVRSGTAIFGVSVRASSIQRTLGMVRNGYSHAGGRLVLPVDPGSSSGHDPDGADLAALQTPEWTAR